MDTKHYQLPSYYPFTKLFDTSHYKSSLFVNEVHVSFLAYTLEVIHH